MVTCEQCGETLRPDSYFCVGCGHAVPESSGATPQARTVPAPDPAMSPTTWPTPERPRTTGGGWRPASKATGAVGACVAMVVLVVVVSLANNGFGSSSNSGDVSANGFGTSVPQPVSTSGYAGLSTRSAYPTGTSSPPPSSTDGVPDNEAAAHTLLQQQVDRDRSRAEALTGYWLPQLSAKKPGLVVRGETFDYRRTWADFTANRVRHPDALLVWSGDFSGFRYKDFWITIVPNPFGDGESANNWCVSVGIGKDDCYAKRLSHSGGYEGNTLVRK